MGCPRKTKPAVAVEAAAGSWGVLWKHGREGVAVDFSRAGLGLPIPARAERVTRWLDRVACASR